MCEISNKFILCTCLKDDAPSIGTAKKRLKHFLKQSISSSKQEFTWTLYRYIGYKETEILGSLRMPNETLGNLLSNDYVLENINNRHCFDFDYEPNEGDNLQIEQHEHAEFQDFLSFIFRNGEWQADSYYTFTEKIRAFNLGKVQVEEIHKHGSR